MTQPFANGFRLVDEYSLYVNDLPEELNEDGIRKIFKQYGIITAIIAPSDAKFAFISYPSYAEAEAAIRGLNGKPPLYLQVQFRRKKSDQNPQAILTSGAGLLGPCPRATQSPLDFRYPTQPLKYPPTTNGSLPLARMHLNIPPPTINSPNVSMNLPSPINHHQNLVNHQPFIYHQGTHSLVSPNDLFANSNHLWTRGTMTIDAAERRHVTMGRGLTNYHIPEPHPRIAEHIAKVMEKRQPGFFESGIDKLSAHIGICLNCGKSATLRCSSCQRFYCCWECQVSDWQRHHATECLRIPSLINSAGESVGALYEPQTASSTVSNQTLSTPLLLTPPITPSTPTEKEITLKPVAKLTDPVPTTLRRPKNLVKYKIIPETEKNEESQQNHDEKTEESPVTPSKVQEPKVDEPSKLVESPKPTAKLIENHNHLVESSKPAATLIENEKKPEAPSPMKKIIQSTDEPKEVCPPQEIKMKPEIREEKEMKKVEPERFQLDLSSDDMFAFQPNDFISRTSFTDVQIMVIDEPGRVFWVQKVSDADDIIKLMENLNEIGDGLPKVVEPVPEKTYAIKYDVLWHRGQIIDVCPLTVDYIDYGTIDSVEVPDFRDLGELADVPRFSKRISLPTSSIEKHMSLHEESLIGVRMVGYNNEEDIIEVITKSDEDEMNRASPEIPVVIEVNPQPRQVGKTTEKKEMKIPPPRDELESVLDMLVIDSEVLAEICEVSSTTSAVGILISKALDDTFTLLLDPLKEECDKIAPTHADFVPKVYDYVCFQKPEDIYWLRGRVMSIGDELTIASLDEGIIATAKVAIPIPEKFRKLCTFAVQLKTTDKFSIEQGNPFTLQILSWEKEKELGHVVKAMIKKHNMPVELTPWTPWISTSVEVPPVLQKIVPPAPALKNKTTVTIQSHQGISTLFLRSSESEEVERCHRLIQDIAKEALTAKSLTQVPAVDDFVLAQFIDENFYRAQVAIIDGKDIKIVYIDYGNFEVTELSKLRVMPESLMDRPMCIVKASLKGLKTIPPTKEACEYIGLLTGREENLVCLFEGSFDDGVILTTSSGENVNDKVNDLLTPSWEKEKIAEEAVKNDGIFYMDSIDIGKLGEIGQLVSAPLLEILEPGLKYVFAPYDREIICEIMEIMPGKTKAYCDTNTDHYIPRSGELCIAMFEDGNWYRGCCVNPSDGPKSALIYFVDFGNIARTAHENIREITKDFLHPAAMGCVCNVANFAGSNGQVSTQILNRLNELLVREEAYQVKLLRVNKDQEYEIELPEIMDILVKEKLLAA